jgi:general stress protein 26
VTTRIRVPVKALTRIRSRAQAGSMTDNQHDDAPRTETERVEGDMTAAEVTGPEAIARLKELVEDIDIAALTTRDAASNLVSRPMSTREMDANGDIWFFTLDDSKKVDDAELHHEVGLAYLDTSGHRYVSIAGRATVVHDRAHMERLYSPSLDIWFENGLDTPALALLRVTPVECEYWEPRHGKLATAAGMLKALVTRDTPDDTMVHGHVSC